MASSLHVGAIHFSTFQNVQCILLMNNSEGETALKANQNHPAELLLWLQIALITQESIWVYEIDISSLPDMAFSGKMT